MADAILSFAIETIGKLLIDEANFLTGVSEQVKFLQNDLQKMLWFLKYADTKQSARESVQPWVSEFRDIAYEANDMIEDYVFRVAIRKTEGCTNTLQRYSCFFSEWLTLHDFGSEIQSLRTRISDLTKNFSEYGVAAIMEEQGSSSVQQQLRRTYSFFSKSEEDFVGLQSDVDVLVKYLLNEGKFGYKSMVSIYGMGGIGKTTIAKKVYHHPRVRQEFKGFAWYCISQQWTMKDILQGILVKLIPEQESQIMASAEDKLVEKLRGVMQERRCLIILDDIWSNAAWDCIKPAFCIGENGSKILLTTRIRDLAVYVDPNGYHHQPRFLTEKESWELLEKKSIRNKSAQGEKYHKFKELGMKMVQYCGGLPLAVTILGGILKTKENLDEWSTVHDNIKSYLGRSGVIGQSEGGVPQALAFSYYDLPYQLKPCFVYLGKFKEDEDIETEKLYQMWMAEGLVLENDRLSQQESMMDVAERYLGELAQRCMVQVEIQDQWPTDAITRFKSCRLHDLMRDLCLLKAKEENFFRVSDFQQGTDDTGLSTDSSPISSSQRFYRLVIRHDENDFSKDVLPPKEQVKHMRSLWLMSSRLSEMPRQKKTIKPIFSNSKMLRVLVIEDLPQNMSHMKMDGIGNLIHLRYLRLKGSCIFTFPSSFSNLRYLETLDLSDAMRSAIPDVLWMMTNLRHLYLYKYMDHFSSHKLRLSGLSKLEILDYFKNTMFTCDPQSLSKLTSLRVFKGRVQKKLEDLESIINHISKLNYLCVSELEVEYLDFCENSADRWSNLLEGMLFCRNIHKLKVSYTLLTKLPHYHTHFSPGLRELELAFTKIEEDPMVTLEEFPNLQRLVLLADSFVGKEMVCHAMGFPQLTYLHLLGLPNLEKWEINEGAMPKLSHLKVWLCEKLQLTKDDFKSITSLTYIDLSGNMRGGNYYF